MKKTSFILSLSLILSAQVKAEPVPGDTLLELFGSSCATGEYTQNALAVSKSLIGTLERLASDVDCQSAAGSLSSLQQLQSQLTSLSNLNGPKAEIAELDAQEQQLYIHLSASTDPDTQSEINALLRALQVQRAALVSKGTSNNQLMGADKTQLAINAVYSVQSLFSQLSSDKKCMAKHPSVLNQATSIVAAVGAGVSMINPAIGFGLNIGANFIGATVEGVRKVGISRNIRRLSNDTLVVQGVKCAIETMSDRYCLSLDTEKFVNFKNDMEVQAFDQKPIGQALLLADRQLPIFMEWLKKIRAGVEPTTTAEASRQSVAIQRDAIIRSIQVESIGLINNSRDTYNSYAADPEKQWNFLRSIIKRLAPGDSGFSSSSSITNPLYDIKPGGYGPYYLIGLAADDPDIFSFGNYKPLDSWQKPATYRVTLDNVKDRFETWIKEATQLVERERTLVQQPDAQKLLHAANYRLDERYNITPLEALSAIITFIEANPPGDASFNRLFESTIERLTLIEKTTKEAMLLDLELPTEPQSEEPKPTGSNPEAEKKKRQDDPHQAAVKKIYRTAQLDYGTIVLDSRIEMMLALSLYEMILKSPPADQALVGQFLAASRFSENLKRGVAKSDTQILDDIDNSKRLMQKNLENFVLIFGNNIDRMLKGFLKEEQKLKKTQKQDEHEDQIASVRFQRSHICHLLLSVPNVGRHLDLQACVGTNLDSRFKNGPSTPSLRLSDFDARLNQRACTRREYFRQNLIFEKWRIR